MSNDGLGPRDTLTPQEVIAANPGGIPQAVDMPGSVAYAPPVPAQAQVQTAEDRKRAILDRYSPAADVPTAQSSDARRKAILDRYSAPAGSPQAVIDQDFEGLPPPSKNQPLIGQVPVKTIDEQSPYKEAIASGKWAADLGKQYGPDVLKEIINTRKSLGGNAGLLGLGGLAIQGGVAALPKLAVPAAKIISFAEAYRHGDEILKFLKGIIP